MEEEIIEFEDRTTKTTQNEAQRIKGWRGQNFRTLWDSAKQSYIYIVGTPEEQEEREIGEENIFKELMAPIFPIMIKIEIIPGVFSEHSRIKLEINNKKISGKP